MSSFVIHPLPAGAVDVEASTARQTVADSPLPCRRCLRNATIGDPLVLAAYNPFAHASPYTGDGPVFVHASDCEPFRPVPDAVSEQVERRLLSVRAYDEDAMMTGATVIAGEQFAARVPDLLSDPHTAFLHVHFAGPGCFAFRVDRA